MSTIGYTLIVILLCLTCYEFWKFTRDFLRALKELEDLKPANRRSLFKNVHY